MSIAIIGYSVTAQAIQDTSIPFSRAIKESLPEFPKSTGRQQAIRTSLMTDSNSLDIQQFSQLIQPAMKAVAELHQMLYIINSREVNVDKIEEAGLSRGQSLACQELQKVPKIIAAVKRYPVHSIIQNNPRRHQQLTENL
eukprot:TRINITY_DN2851_c1_g1_i1.p2 TRINITY_DN2851_c1_g1~~TRINITY_DN2851_c1_g1_i1.p2  ORF type:complete len:140 (+),score=15.54 TRINITY_DN2851_c1_g1_i1:143-562(+)